MRFRVGQAVKYTGNTLGMYCNKDMVGEIGRAIPTPVDLGGINVVFSSGESWCAYINIAPIDAQMIIQFGAEHV
jgi:hypothetical protein